MKAKMLFVTHKYPPSVGGMETHCYELYKRVSASMDTVMMRLPENASRVWWLITLKKRIRRFLKENSDITHVYFHDGLSGLVCRDIKRYSRVRTIVTFHGLDVVYPNGWYQKRIRDNLKNHIDAIIPVSTATARECINRGAPEERIHVVPNGVDLSLKDIPEDKNYVDTLEKRLGVPLRDKKILISIGRSVKRKGFSWFLNNVLPKLDEDMVYFMVGPREDSIRKKLFLMGLLPEKLERQIWLMGVGIDQVDIDAAIERPAVKGRAFHLGKVPFGDLVQLLKHSYAFVMPNIKIQGDAEGFGLVALEAVMCGTAVLASGLEGITEAIQDGRNGLLVEPENPEAWVNAVHNLCGNVDYRNKLAEKAVSYTEKNFSWDIMSSGYLRVFSGMK